MHLDGFVDISPVLRAGVYALGFHGQIVYVGKSKSMYSRVYSHRNQWNNARRGKAGPSWLPASVKAILFDEVYIRPCSLEALDALEREMIDRYKPKYNIVHKTKEKVSVPITLNVGGVLLALNAHIKPPEIVRRI